MQLDFIKIGATGFLTINDYQTIQGETKNTRSHQYTFHVDNVRTKDFIIVAENEKAGILKRMYCNLPVNKKDGSEVFWLTDDKNGFVRQYKDRFTDNRGIVYCLTETVYQFN